MRSLLPLLLLALVALPVDAQGVTDPTAQPMEAGRRALDSGRSEEALQHFLNAYLHRPFDVEILAGLLEVSASDADARTLWSHAWAAAAADERGRAKAEGDLRKLLVQKDPLVTRIAAARASAVKELVRLAATKRKAGGSSPEELLVARWADELAAELMVNAPALRAAHGDDILLDAASALAVSNRTIDGVMKELERQMISALSSQNPGLGIRFARVLHGLGAQADFKDLQGEAPSGTAKYRRSAAEGLARGRAQLGSRMDEPWTVEDLEWLGQEESEAFTRDHATFGNPGVALSPGKRYRVETRCGYETLLGVARTIEDHHRRLANWYGQDPFLDRQGTVRIVPDADGLESEGSPFWWAGGFQGGDVTTMRFACGTIEGLGHGLTHELTHRFDGAIYPGQPAWLSEGKAVWTGAAYRHSSEDSFVPNFASYGTIEAAFIKGYGGIEKLTELIEGTIEDYRDNYVAGYALYVYLNSWEPERKQLFRTALQRFMDGARDHTGDPLEWFVACFCDGEGGRPASLEEFSEGFADFVKGFYWEDRQPFTERYEPKLDSPYDSDPVLDEPTWVWSRNRAEPVFGQDQARRAGELFEEIGKRAVAADALVWALSADGRTPATEARLAKLLAGAGKKNAAWVLEQRASFPGPTAEPAPFLGALSKTRALAELLGEAVRNLTEDGREHSARALGADHNRLARRLGLSELPLPSASPSRLLHPFDQAPRHAGTLGWAEGGLTEYEEKRVEGLWYAAEDGSLHVGRERPRSGTGRMDRQAHQRHAFVRSDEWLAPGVYRLRARIQFTTSFVTGAVIVGHTRRDRNIRFQFSGGSFQFAIGANEDEPTFEELGWQLHGLRQRDYALRGSVRGGSFLFDPPTPVFDLELLVEGARVTASINNEVVGHYHTVDGAPIEGYVGFATGQGAIRVQDPSVQRLDRSRLAGAGYAEGLDLVQRTSQPFRDLANRPVLGLEPSSNGRLVIWVPVPEGTPEVDWSWGEVAQDAEKAARSMARGMARELAPQPMTLFVPAGLGETELQALRLWCAAELPVVPEVRTHDFDGTVPAGQEEPADEYKSWVLFVDSARVARFVAPLSTQRAAFDDELSRWLGVFRDHGRPDRELPPYGRESDSDPERGGSTEGGQAGD